MGVCAYGGVSLPVLSFPLNVCILTINIMPRYNIFIRESNRDKFEALPQKSALINELLERHWNIHTVGRPSIVEVDVDQDEDFTICNHGSPRTLCKYAKPGRPCRK